MVKIDTNRFPLGTAIVVTATTGHSFSGVLREVSDSHILLQHDQGEVILSTDLIGTLEVGQSPVDGQSPTNSDWRSSDLITTAQGVERLNEIEHEFSAAVSVPQLSLIQPDFVLSKKELEGIQFSKRSYVQTQWNRIKNQFDYAIKIKEFDRLADVANRCQALVTEFPQLVSASSNLGWVYWKLNRKAEAIKAYETSVAKTSDLRAMHNLLVLAVGQNEPQRTFHALKQFFERAEPAEYRPTWNVVLRLALDFEGSDFLYYQLEKALEGQPSKSVELVLKSISYYLSNKGRPNSALAAAVLSGRSDAGKQELNFIKLLLNREDDSPPFVTQDDEPSPEFLDQNGFETAYSPDSDPMLLSQQGRLTEADPAASASDFEEVQETAYTKARRLLKSRIDPVRAEPYLREAIAKRENLEAAVKDLALVLQNTNREGEAVSLLRGYADRVIDKLTINELLANLYQRLNRHSDAITALYKVLPETSEKKQYLVRLRIAISQIQIGELTQARRTLDLVLRGNPHDTTALELARILDDGLDADDSPNLGGLTQEKINAYSLDIGDFSSALSRFLRFYLDDCEYLGLSEEQVQARDFSEEDIHKLKELIGVGRRSGVRAQYCLSAAKLLQELQSGEEHRFFSYMQDYALDMGEASLLEQKRTDVVLAYYLEAFAIAPKLTAKLQNKLPSIMMLFYASRDDVIVEKLPDLELCFAEAMAHPKRRELLEWLLELSLLTSQVDRYLLPKVFEREDLRRIVQNTCEEIIGNKSDPSVQFSQFTAIWKRAAEHIGTRNQQLINELLYLQSRAGLDSTQDQIERVQQLNERIPSSLDRTRLKTITEILQLMGEYSKQHLYIERERLSAIVQKRVVDFLEQVKDEPTKISLELLRPYVVTLGASIKEHFDRVQQAAEPDTLDATLSVESYIPDRDSNVECQITLSNAAGKSPASEVKIEIEPSPASEYEAIQKTIPVTEALPDGQPVTCQLPVRVTQNAKIAQVFTLHYGLSYRTRTGRQIRTSNQIPIRLDHDSDFTQIKNPYAAWAEAHEVTDENMFYGRGPLIDNLLSALRSSPEAKSIVVYGQKRAGKSSVLYWLNLRLMLPVIPVKFSIGDISLDLSVSTFLYRIAQRLEAKFDDLAHEGHPAITVRRPELEELRSHPELRFHDYMMDLRKAIAGTRGFEGAKVILLLDEFTYIYSAIRKKLIPETFMQFWKALLQAGYFGSVVVGQDSMRQFIDEFPNEFQVAQSERVSYLAEDDARALIEQPTRMESGESRFKGAAVNRMLELTAGSPFYVQIFCNRLVEFMNRKKLVRVTDAHIEQVKKELISGTNSLTGDKFDNLIGSGDDSTNLISSKDTAAVLKEIAAASKNQEFCDQSDIGVVTTARLDDILDDLVRREVIEKRKASLYRIRVGLFKEWLLAQ